MKLLVDAIPYDGGKSGISVYIENVVREFAALGHELTLIVEPGAGEAVTRRIRPEDRARISFLEAPRWTRRAALSMLWHLFVLPRRIKWKRYHALFVLAANRRMPGFVKIPTVAVVHDLSQYHVEAKYGPLRMFYIKRLLPRYVRKAHRVVAISRSTARDLVAHWHIPESRVTVVYNGFTPPEKFVDSSNRRFVDSSIRRFDDSLDLRHSESTNRQIDKSKNRSTLLYISRIEHPGKNHVKLIEAYGMLPREVAAAHHLVFVGGDWNGAAVVHAAAEASPYREFIEFAGFVPQDNLARIWADAAGYVFPSRFEGFGLSLLEAMAAGVPCACSRTSSLGELGEGVAELFDPESPGEIAAALSRLLSGDNAARIAAGRERAASFSWPRCAAGLLAAFPPARVFGVPIDCTTMSAALAEIKDSSIRRFVDSSICQSKDSVESSEFSESSESTNRRIDKSRNSRFFAFVNAHCLNVAYRDREYAEILRRADRVWPDGTGVRMAGRRLGFPVPENVNGTDMFPLLEGRVFLFGAAPGVAEKAAENARRLYPKMEIVGTAHGYGDEDEVVAAVNRARPDILLVALGVPLQEKWIARNLARLDCGAVIAVGGLLDFVSGRIPRAPAWMRRLGIEWFYRFLQEPRRMFRRYIIGNPLFLWRLRNPSSGASSVDNPS